MCCAVFSNAGGVALYGDVKTRFVSIAKSLASLLKNVEVINAVMGQMKRGPLVMDDNDIITMTQVLKVVQQFSDVCDAAGQTSKPSISKYAYFLALLQDAAQDAAGDVASVIAFKRNIRESMVKVIAFVSYLA